jgi:hypothetical protein
MKYCNYTTINHHIAVLHNNCLQDINYLITKEGYLGTVSPFINNETVIYLDLAEELIAITEGRSKNKSMDMAFGLTNSDSSIKEMLMVELRLNYSNPNNLNRAELEGKVAGSSLLLSNIPEIHNRFIFIFKTNQRQEARNRLSRMIPRINSNYIVMDIPELHSTYF